VRLESPLFAKQGICETNPTVCCRDAPNADKTTCGTCIESLYKDYFTCTCNRDKGYGVTFDTSNSASPKSLTYLGNQYNPVCMSCPVGFLPRTDGVAGQTLPFCHLFAILLPLWLFLALFGCQSLFHCALEAYLRRRLRRQK